MIDFYQGLIAGFIDHVLNGRILRYIYEAMRTDRYGCLDIKWIYICMYTEPI